MRGFNFGQQIQRNVLVPVKFVKTYLGVISQNGAQGLVVSKFWESVAVEGNASSEVVTGRAYIAAKQRMSEILNTSSASTSIGIEQIGN